MGLVRDVKLCEGKRLLLILSLCGVGSHDQDNMLNHDKDVNHAWIVLDAPSSILSTILLGGCLAFFHNRLTAIDRLSALEWDDEDRADMVAHVEEPAVLLGPPNEGLDLFFDQRGGQMLSIALAIAADTNVKIKKTPKCFLRCEQLDDEHRRVFSPATYHEKRSSRL